MEYWCGISERTYVYLSIATMLFTVVVYLTAVRFTRNCRNDDRVDYSTMMLALIIIFCWVPLLQYAIAAATVIIGIVFGIMVLNQKFQSFDERINDCLKVECSFTASKIGPVEGHILLSIHLKTTCWMLTTTVALIRL